MAGVNRLRVLIALETESKLLRPLEGVAEASPDEAAAFMRAMAALPPPLVAQFRAALLALAQHYTGWGPVNRWATRGLAHLQAHAPWRAAVRADLALLAADSDENVQYLASQALAAEGELPPSGAA